MEVLVAVWECFTPGLCIKVHTTIAHAAQRVTPRSDPGVSVPVPRLGPVLPALRTAMP